MAVDVLAARAGVRKGGEIAEAWMAPVQIGGEEALLVKPLAFMNRSGVAVDRVMSLHGAAPQDLVVIVDEIALDLGRVRVRERGSHGGHNGLRSLIEVLGTEEFPRVRIGIRKGETGEDLAAYVLAPFPDDDVLVVQESVARAADAVECALRDGIGVAMNQFNGIPKV
jgi:PTH1 family peptidyl-tRNA hydrolase